MADTFYFNSPKLPSFFKNRADLRARLKPGRRTRAENMEIPPQHAYVVRLEEPIFCQSYIDSIISHLPRGNSILSFSSPHDVQATSSIPNSQLERSQLERPIDNSIRLQTLHPRPHSPDTWEEEEGRRTRFALDDGEEVDRLRQWRLQCQQSSLSSDAPASRTAVRAESTEGDDITFPFDFERPEGIDEEPQEPSPGRSLSSSRRTQMYPTRQPVESMGERTNLSQSVDPSSTDEIITVDDPRRSYDFADFMLKWRLEWFEGKQGIPPLEAGPQPFIADCRATKDITPTEMTQADVDMQGLSWDLLGSTRYEALAARVMLHHSESRSSIEQLDFNKFSTDEYANDEMFYRFRAYLPQHRPNFSHYQLRNVLAANNRNDMFYANNSKVMHASLSCPSIVKPVLDLHNPINDAAQFQITCLATNQDLTFSDYRSDNVLIAGGFFGEYAIENLALETGGRHHQGIVTHSYNGLINYVEAKSDRLSGSLRAAFISNDRTVRTMDIRTLRLMDCFTYEHAINCCSMSPDRRLRALIGDSQETLITNAESGDVLVTLKAHKDYGFACAWSQDSRYLVTSAQDDQVLVWDTRRWDRPLKTFGNIMSCPRTLHFADDGALIVAEDDDIVSIYDSSFDTRRDIRFFGSIAGLALLDGGAEMVVANADRTVGGLLSFQRASMSYNSGAEALRMLADDDLQDLRHRLPYSSCGIDVLV